MQSHRRICRLTAILLLLIGPTSAIAVELEDAAFSVNFNTVFGQSVYVLGDIPELGAGDPANAVKLEPGIWPTWRAAVALPKGINYSYQYTVRNDSVPQWSNPANTSPFGSVINASTGAADPHPAKKGMYYHSGWSAPVLFWRTGTGGAFTATPMQAFGPGRSAGETRFRAVGVSQGERLIQFHITDGGAGRDPASGEYATMLNAFFLQDGHIFDYTPAAAVSAQRRDYTPANPPGINSVNLGEFRRYRVFLPRGYDQHTSKNYPVLYMHDGQNIFEVGPFGSWNAHLSLDTLTRAGTMREIIVVGVDNTANRLNDYRAPDDGGEADDYAAFLIDELKPLVDANYRTLPDRDNTASIGSSLGGVVSLYLGWDHNDVFGRCGPMSGSWQLANFPNRVKSEPYRDLRVYFDSGDCCATSYDNAWGTMSLRDNFLTKGYVLGRDMRHVVGYGHQHNEAAWAARLPFALEFLFPATESENPLLKEIFTGDLDGDGDMDADDWALFFDCMNGPNQPPAASCPAGVNADLDADGDADLDDAAVFAVYFSG